MAAGRLKSTRSKILTFVVYIGLAAIVGGVLGYIDGDREAAGQAALVNSSSGVWLGLVLGGILAVIAMVYGFFWMRSIDEAAQEAHKWSWYWGGSAGMAVGMIGLVMAMMPVAAKWQPPVFMDRTDPVAYMGLGAVVMLSLMMLGYGVAWLWWWWSRR